MLFLDGYQTHVFESSDLYLHFTYLKMWKATRLRVKIMICATPFIDMSYLSSLHMFSSILVFVIVGNDEGAKHCCRSACRMSPLLFHIILAFIYYKVHRWARNYINIFNCIYIDSIAPHLGEKLRDCHQYMTDIIRIEWFYNNLTSLFNIFVKNWRALTVNIQS
jgi:hypothetical protein